jgi:hypothetical protein
MIRRATVDNAPAISGQIVRVRDEMTYLPRIPEHVPPRLGGVVSGADGNTGLRRRMAWSAPPGSALANSLISRRIRSTGRNHRRRRVVRTHYFAQLRRSQEACL